MTPGKHQLTCNTLPPDFKNVMEESFLQNYDKYISWIEKRREKDGRQMRVPDS